MRRYRESTRELLYRLRDAMGPDVKIKELLPRTLKDIIYVQKRSTCIDKVRLYFSKYTDRWYRVPSEEVCCELLQVNRFLQLHLYMFNANAEHEDDTPIILFKAHVPETMLNILRQCFSPEFLLSNPSMRRLPYLSIQILAYFFHRKSQTFLLVPDRIFHDSPQIVDYLVEILRGGLTWFESIIVAHIFAMFSYSPAGAHWFQSRPDVIKRVLKLTYRATEIVDEKIAQDEVNWRDEGLVSVLGMFREGEDLQVSAKLIGLLSTNHAIMVMENLLDKFRPDYEKFTAVSGAVRKAEVLSHFSHIMKCTMTWVTPGQYLHPFLSSVFLILGTHRALEDLFLDNLAVCTEKNMPVGIESFKYWKHSTRHPTPLAFYLVHAFAMNDTIARSDWCIYTLCYLLREGDVKAAEAIVQHYGHELMDLAHLVQIESPTTTSVQPVVLGALLRYGGFTHKVYNYDETFEGTVKPPGELPDFCLEAALFAKKAQCETKMSLEEKQKRVVMADTEKDQGNGAFKDANYNDAIIKYTNAIAICPLSARTKQSIYYSNRAECYLRVNDAKRAIHDCNRALCLDKTTRVKVQWRRSRAYQKLNLDYPAWLDMKCLESEWRRSQANSGINFHQLLSSLTDQVGVHKASLLSDVETKLFAIYH